MTPLLIGITGRAGAGKDSAARTLNRIYNFQTVRFSGALKAGLMAMLDLTEEQIENREFRDKPLYCGKTLRELMITLGTEWGREQVHPDFWVFLLGLRWVKIRASSNPRMVVPDVRFDNEARFIKEQGGLIVEVIRPGAGLGIRHKSEDGISRELIDSTIRNDADLYTLNHRMREWLNRVLPTD